jgi:hypothetical protein
MISTKLHAVLDYLVGILLIAAPWLFHFSHVMPATVLIASMGIVTLCYSLLTDYEFSFLPMIPFTTHLVIDFVSGLLLLCAPWLLHFNEQTYLPFLIIGIFEIIVVLLSKKTRRN